MPKQNDCGRMLRCPAWPSLTNQAQDASAIETILNRTQVLLKLNNTVFDFIPINVTLHYATDTDTFLNLKQLKKFHYIVNENIEIPTSASDSANGPTVTDVFCLGSGFLVAQRLSRPSKWCCVVGVWKF